MKHWRKKTISNKKTSKRMAITNEGTCDDGWGLLIGAFTATISGKDF